MMRTLLQLLHLFIKTSIETLKEDLSLKRPYVSKPFCACSTLMIPIKNKRMVISKHILRGMHYQGANSLTI